MEDINKRFTFWCPLEKSEEIVDPTTGEKTMRLGGIASTSDEDSDGEFLDPKGFDIKPLMKSGLVNWHHQAKGQPSAIIGEPSKGEIRKDGLYLEVDLYPSSKIANEVFELAEILEKDSNTRRLGFSIEGKVLKRKSNDKNNPDYNHIEKAVITGVAVTHMPKNPKTFANIIKGEIDEELEKEEEDNENKALTADGSGKPLKKESVDKNLKVTTFKKSEVMDRIFNDCAGITISKAEKIFVLIKNISKMKNRKNITEEDIEKAYETLGLDIEKGCCGSADGGKTKKFNKSEEEEEEVKKKKIDTSENDKVEEEEEEEEYVDDDDDDEEEKACKKGEDEDEDEDDSEDDEKGVEKGGNRFDSIEKAISQLGDKSFDCMRALGVMLKDTNNELKKSRTQINEMNEIIKSQSDEISELREMVEAYGDSTPAPKSLSHAHAVERRFNKANENDFEESKKNENTVSMSRQRNIVSELLDQATFAKGGFDEEFSKACTTFEASHVLPNNIIQRMKKEFNVTIVD